MSGRRRIFAVRKPLARIWSAIRLDIPARYAGIFMESITRENVWRIIVGGVVLSIIEIGVFFSRGIFSAFINPYPMALVLFNVLTIPLFVLLLKQKRQIRRLRYVVYLVVLFYLVWACFYSWSARSVMPFSEVIISLYILMVFGAAVFIYMEPLWSACLFTASLALFLTLLPRSGYSYLQVLGHIWNAIGLNLFAWLVSRLLFGFRLRTFVAQKELELARAKSDALLLNVLPAKIVEDLKQKGTTTPERFDRVTVLFSDLVNFSGISNRLSPEVLVGELNDLFAAFDDIVKRYHCERIKTIGDAYLCVCGMPRPHPRHTERILEAAQEMVAFIRERNRSHSPSWQIRIGVHSGSVVGGIVGTQKYIYDVFGDTINIAHRLEQHSVPMHINVSEATFSLARGSFRFSRRGPVEVKGIGTMPMYFLEDKNDTRS